MKKTYLLVLMVIVFLSIVGCTDKNDQLFEALRNDDYAQASRLLTQGGIDVNCRDKYGYTPLHRCENEQLARLLIAQGADPNAKGAGVDPGMSPLDNINLGKFGTFDLNELKRGDDYTPLHTVSNYQVAKVLLENGADVNALANYDVTPLHQAAKAKDNYPLVTLLLDCGATVNARTSYNKTPLHGAMFYAWSNNGRIVKLLVEQSADVNAQDNSGSTPLHSLRQGDVKLASYLVDHGADVTLATDNGNQPICYAIGDNHVELMKFYIMRGDSVLSKCSEGRTIVEYAEQRASPSTAAVVRDTTLFLLREFNRILDEKKTPEK